MPTYDYKCEACGHAFEKFQPISAPPIRKCPECGKNQVKRLIGTGAGLIFKGGGFYQTDYRSDSYKAEAKKETGSGDSGAKGDAAAKPDAPAKPTEKKSSGTDGGEGGGSAKKKSA